MKTRSRGGNAVEDDRDTESDESSFDISTIKRKLPMKVTDHIQKYGRNGLQRMQNHMSPNMKRELQSSRDDDPKSPVATSSHSNSNEMFINGGENDPKQLVRRSTRQRKFMYDNLNQTWLLASSIPDFAKLEPLFTTEQRSPGEEQCVSMRPRRSERNRSYELRRLGLATDGLEFEDMYSRVKRKRRKTVHSFYARRISQDGGSMADTEDTDRNEMSDSDTIDDHSDLEEGMAEGLTISGKPREGMEIDSVVHGPKYSLRPKKPITERFQFPIQPVRPKRSATATLFEATQHHQRPRERETFKSTAHRSPLFKRKRHAIHNSTSSSSDDELRFEKRKAISMARARNRCLPLNFIEDDLTKGAVRDRMKIGSSLADIDPMSIDKTVSFELIGGLDKHIKSLKEMVLFPLMYPEVFQRFKIAPPRGVLFYGQPGTGKTLVARALANECSTGDKRVAFFMRKGADCLSKWVGESERQLRLLFDQAYSMRPSIIFFDEIDGLAPVRSTRQDQIHSSIVSTLLALMDGLDNRGEIVIIGATNRLDAIDPALRRPGRFDRELLFPLPSVDAREMILKIMMKEWVPSQPDSIVSELAARTAGYCGADIKALCSEAALVALRRRYPQIYSSKQKLQLDVETIQVLPQDFGNALKKMKPSVQRSAVVSAKPLITVLKPLLDGMLQTVVSKITKIFPLFKLNQKKLCNNQYHADNVCSVDFECLSEDSDCSFAQDEVPVHYSFNNIHNKDGLTTPRLANHLSRSTPFVHRPHFLISGKEGQGQGSLAPAILYLLEGVSVHRLDIPSLYAVTSRAPEEACAQIFHEAQRNLPSVIFLPHIRYWWETLSDTVRATFLSLMQDLDPSTPLMLFATSDVTFDKLPKKIQEIFGTSSDQLFLMRNPNEKERKRFFSTLCEEIYRLPKKPALKANLEELPVAPPPVLRKLTTTELNKLRQKEEATLRELRLFLRDILTKLARDRRFSVFSRPVDPDEVPDYEEVIRNPMDLETMMTKIDSHQYETVAQFLSDIDLVCNNALEYNPDRYPSDKLIRHRACSLKDVAHALVLTELDDDFEKICLDIQATRRERGETPAKFIPKRYPMPKAPVSTMEPTQESNVEKVTAPTPEASGSVKSPSREKHVKLPNEVSPTRYSKRIRGMGAPPLSSDTQHKKSFSSPKRAARYIIWRRKKSPWFGSCRRKLIRRTNKCGKRGRPRKFQINSKIRKISEPLYPTQDSSIPEDKYLSLNPSISVPVPHEERKEMSGTDSSATIISPKTDMPPSALSLDRDLYMSHEVTSMPVPDDVNFNESVHSTSKFKSQVSCDISVDFNCSTNSLRNCPPIIVSIKSPRKQSPLKGHEIIKETVPIAEIEMEVETANFIMDQDSRCVARQIVIDRIALENFMDHLLRVTEGCTVEKLLQLYSLLQQCIYKHRKELNKQDLMNDLERTVDCFSHHKPS